MGRTCGEPDEIKKNTHPKYVTALCGEQAAVWYRKAAEQGQASAQCDLGSAYASGRGVPRDDAAAARWWRQAAEQGNMLAQRGLSQLYEAGRGVRVVSRTISPPWGSIRFCLALRAYSPWAYVW